MALSIQDLMDKMPGAFLPEKAGDADFVIQFKFSGADAGEWFVVIKDGACKAEKGEHDAPTMTLSSDSQDYIDIITGKLDAMKAFMQGKVKLAGDLNLAMKLTSLFAL